MAQAERESQHVEKEREREREEREEREKREKRGKREKREGQTEQGNALGEVDVSSALCKVKGVTSSSRVTHAS